MDKYNEEPLSPQAALQVASVFRSINLMSVGVATLLSAGMVADRHSVTVSVLSGKVEGAHWNAMKQVLAAWRIDVDDNKESENLMSIEIYDDYRE